MKKRKRSPQRFSWLEGEAGNCRANDFSTGKASLFCAGGDSQEDASDPHRKPCPYAGFSVGSSCESVARSRVGGVYAPALTQHHPACFKRLKRKFPNTNRAK